MRILLLNDNPVVNKLVTLSAQKTSDELDVVNSLDEIKHNNYDLLVLDDTVYTPEILDKLQDIVKFSKSLFIYSKTSKEIEGFTSTLKKPFLPTDLVERFSIMGREISENVAEEEIEFEDNLNIEDDTTIQDELESESTPESELELEDISSLDDEISDLEDDIGSLDDEIQSLDDETLDLDMHLDLEDTEKESSESEPQITLDENLEDLLDESPVQEEVLDEEDIKEIQDLLEDTEEVLPDLEEEEPLEELVDELNDLEDEAPIQEEEILDEPLSPEEEILDESALEIDDESLSPEEEISDESALEIDDESQSLESENIDPLSNLNSRDIKLAIGEDISTNSTEEQSTTTSEKTDPVESLKNLLAILSDNNIASSLKGAKISINISFGDD